MNYVLNQQVQIYKPLGRRKLMKNSEYISKAVLVQLTRLGMTQSDLAAKVGVSYSFFNNLINNKTSNNWDIDLMDKVASALGVGDAFALAERAEYERNLDVEKVA